MNDIEDSAVTSVFILQERQLIVGERFRWLGFEEISRL